MDISVKNSDDLHKEILRLQVLEQVQGATIKSRLSSPSAIFGAVLTLFPKSSTAAGIRSGGLFHQDILGLASRFVLPFVLNKTLFRKSNFIVKALVGLVSQKASHYISEDAATGLFDKIKTSISNLLPKKNNAKTSDAIIIYK
jgi:hypothetical protein